MYNMLLIVESLKVLKLHKFDIENRAKYVTGDDLLFEICILFKIISSFFSLIKTPSNVHRNGHCCPPGWTMVHRDGHEQFTYDRNKILTNKSIFWCLNVSAGFSNKFYF